MGIRYHYYSIPSRIDGYGMSKIRKSARDENCSIRIPGVCNGNPQTTVLAHVNTVRKGIGIKSNDIHAFYSCSCCHDVVDGRRKSEFSRAALIEYQLDAMVETQLKLIDKGLLTIA
jgi:hypothetical protein